EGKRKMDLVDKELSSIEGRYTSVMEKLSKEIADLKASREEEMEKLKKDYEDKLNKVKENHASEMKKLGEEAKVRGEAITSLTQERDA
ncbi:hypothetical protein A2U01_0083470, partial [Trifolium medium]|nr:hypothetical protein [Trifolium medium]